MSWGLVPFVSELSDLSGCAYIEVIDTRTAKPIASIMSSFPLLQQANFDLLSYEVSRAIISLFRQRAVDRRRGMSTPTTVQFRSCAQSLAHIAPGSQWKKPSCPVPTIATVEAVDFEGEEVCLKFGRQRAWWPIERFRHEFRPCEEQTS